MNNQYFELIFQGKLQEAEILRISENPRKLYKYISLDGTDMDDAKFYSLKNNSIWFSSVDSFNDPYEHKGIVLNEDLLIKAGIPKEVVEIYKAMFDTEDLEVACLTANGYKNLPMWAYYANNSKGICIEYDVIRGNAIHEVIYKQDRIMIGNLLIDLVNCAKKAMVGDEESKIKIDLMTRMLMQSLYIKDFSWKHEKEYRIVMPIRKNSGENIPLNDIGIKVSQIIAGVNCSESNKRKLNSISNNLGCGNLKCAILSEKSFGIDIIEYCRETGYR